MKNMDEVHERIDALMRPEWSSLMTGASCILRDQDTGETIYVDTPSHVLAWLEGRDAERGTTLNSPTDGQAPPVPEPDHIAQTRTKVVNPLTPESITEQLAICDAAGREPPWDIAKQIAFLVLARAHYPDALRQLQACMDTNRDLNRRCQAADAATADAKRCLDKLAEGSEKGTPWCGGSMGRALLAWHCSKLEESLTECKAQIQQISALRAKTVTQAADIVTLREALMERKCPFCRGTGRVWRDNDGIDCRFCKGTGIHLRAQAALKATEPE